MRILFFITFYIFFNQNLVWSQEFFLKSNFKKEFHFKSSKKNLNHFYSSKINSEIYLLSKDSIIQLNLNKLNSNQQVISVLYSFLNSFTKNTILLDVPSILKKEKESQNIAQDFTIQVIESKRDSAIILTENQVFKILNKSNFWQITLMEIQPFCIKTSNNYLRKFDLEEYDLELKTEIENCKEWLSKELFQPLVRLNDCRWMFCTENETFTFLNYQIQNLCEGAIKVKGSNSTNSTNIFVKNKNNNEQLKELKIDDSFYYIIRQKKNEIICITILLAEKPEIIDEIIKLTD